MDVNATETAPLEGVIQWGQNKKGKVVRKAGGDLGGSGGGGKVCRQRKGVIG